MNAEEGPFTEEGKQNLTRVYNGISVGTGGPVLGRGWECHTSLHAQRNSRIVNEFKFHLQISCHWVLTGGTVRRGGQKDAKEAVTSPGSEAPGLCCLRSTPWASKP